MKHPISAVIITLNEEQAIEQCLAALRWCDEIVVVDSGSTDRTVEICRANGCSVHQRKFDGYGPQKRWAVSLAHHDWILSVDADEVISDSLRDEIVRELDAAELIWDGLLIPRTMVFLGREFRHGSEHRYPSLRLFNRQRGNFTDARVHEGVEVAGRTKQLAGRMLHYSYRDLHQYFEKFNRYTSAAAEELFREGRHKSLWGVFFALPVNFLKHYLLRRNLFNGYPGLVWSVLSSYYPLVKYLKLRDLERTRRPAA